MVMVRIDLFQTKTQQGAYRNYNHWKEVFTMENLDVSNSDFVSSKEISLYFYYNYQRWEVSVSLLFPIFTLYYGISSP